jgi:hypothetical protein
MDIGVLNWIDLSQMELDWLSFGSHEYFLQSYIGEHLSGALS